MNTKQRLSNDLLNDGEIIIEKRFVKLYESEIDKIDEQISDLKKLDQKDFDAKGEVEEKARAYYRAFAREFYDVCEGRVSDDEFFDLWEREEELKTGINSINSLEGEQKKNLHVPMKKRFPWMAGLRQFMKRRRIRKQY